MECSGRAFVRQTVCAELIDFFGGHSVESNFTPGSPRWPVSSVLARKEPTRNRDQIPRLTSQFTGTSQLTEVGCHGM